jgi:hypothetical protein
VQRRVGELTRELEAAQASELRERDRTTVVEWELVVPRSFLSIERLPLEVEQAAQALAKGQAKSKGQRVTQLEVMLAQKE